MKKTISILLMFITIALLVGCKETNKENVEKKEEKKMDYLILVNKQNKIPEYWEDVVELEETKDAWGDKILVEKQALKRFWELRDALLKENVDIELDSTYRSVSDQQKTWDKFEKEEGLEYAKKYVAVPGYSEHHTGLAIDICLKKKGKIIADNDDMIADRKTFAIIHKHLADYGFILRYLEGHDGITGYAYEPWHFRYVGESVAKEISKKGITLEEYLGKANLDYELDKDIIYVECNKTETIGDVEVETNTVYNFNKNQIVSGMKIKTTYTYKDKDEYEYNVKEQKNSFEENKSDSDTIQDYLADDKNKKLSTLFVYKEMKVSKKEEKNYKASSIITDSEANKNTCKITGATRKELGLK